MRVDPMERVSQGTGLAVVVAALVLIVMGAVWRVPPLQTPPKQETFVVSLQATPPAPPIPAPPAPQPAAPPPPPKRVEPPPPKHTPPPRPRPLLLPVHATTAPTPIAAPKPVFEPLSKVAPPPPPTPAVPTPAPPKEATPTPPAPPPENAALENSFVAKLRTYIRSITQYPTSAEARRQQLEGAVEVSFTLRRSGAVSNVRVSRSSNAPILDRQAVSIVQGGSYPAIPADAWRADGTHSFTVTVEFSPT